MDQIEFNKQCKNIEDKITILQVITVQEAAEILNVTPRQVQRLCEQGKFKCRKANGTWLILRSSL